VTTAAHPWHVVELTVVDDHTLQRALNDAAAREWSLERIDYIQQTGVRRPVMAFLFFQGPTPPHVPEAAGDESDE
jgi:hypothetical protein